MSAPPSKKIKKTDLNQSKVYILHIIPKEKSFYTYFFSGDDKTYFFSGQDANKKYIIINNGNGRSYSLNLHYNELDKSCIYIFHTKNDFFQTIFEGSFWFKIKKNRNKIILSLPTLEEIISEEGNNPKSDQYQLREMRFNF